MLMMTALEYFPKTLEAHVDDPIKTLEIICEKYGKKGNNKLSKLCKALENFTLNNSKVEPYDWFNYLSHLNNRIDKIIIYCRKTEKQLSMKITNNVCKGYKDLKLAIENKVSCLDDLEKLQTTIQYHWENYYYDKETDNESDD